ncbi:MAG TPA: tripartite tricarboxylate transporter substrate binding protein [Burkholderiales bacterium]|nr:tripartite tricarboxylate transporter substrate binding protein [Burkholderiales bacterium]
MALADMCAAYGVSRSASIQLFAGRRLLQGGMRYWKSKGFIAGCVALVAATVHAEIYPSKPIRMIVPFAPGGGADSIGRLMAQKLATALGQQVIVDNRAGAGGRIAAELAAHAAPDGYTLLLGGSTVMMTAPAMYPKLPYDPLKDYTHLSLIAAGTYVLVRHPSVPIPTVKELIAFARAKPGTLNYASSGPGSPGNLAGELFNAMAGVKIIHVPYKGSSAGVVGTISGEVQLMFNNIIPALPAIRDKRLMAIAITSAKRSVLLPDVPTVAESGLPGFAVDTYYGISAPAGLPPAIRKRLGDEVVKATRSPDARTRILDAGCEPVGSSPQEFESVIRAEISKWRDVVTRAGIRGE